MKKINQNTTHRSKVSAILLTCLVLMVVFSIVPISAYAETTIPDATSQFYVNDFADVFTPEEETRLMNTAVTLADNYDGIQVVVTTIESLEGDTIENYANNMYNTYGIGKNDMGLLILLSTGDREIRVEIGRAMETYITDSKSGRFIDKYAIPYLAENKFNEGLIHLQEAFIQEIISCVEKEATAVATVPSQAESVVPSTVEKHNHSFAAKLAGILLGVTLLVLVVMVVYKLTIEKEHKSEVTSLKESIEFERAAYQTEMDRLSSNHSSEVRNLTQKLENAKENYNSLLQEHRILEDRYNRAKTLHPKIDDEVSAMIAEEIRLKDLKIARGVDEKLSRFDYFSASKDIVDDLEYALSQYSQLSETQKSYITCDVSRVRNLYDASLNLKKEYEREQEINRRKAAAAAALTAITAIIAYITVGKASNLSALKNAKSIYDNLDSGSRAYFDRDTAEKLNRLLEQAKRDKRRIDDEEEARRRRQRQQSSSYHSSSSLGGSRSYGGFGGRSGGGGSSRKF